MSNSSATMTIRLPVEVKKRLEQLAQATARSRSRLAASAIETYLELNEWQIREIEAGVREADNGDFATESEVRAVLSKWITDAE